MNGFNDLDIVFIKNTIYFRISFVFMANEFINYLVQILYGKKYIFI